MTYERIIEILQEHSFESIGYGRVISDVDFDKITNTIFNEVLNTINKGINNLKSEITHCNICGKVLEKDDGYGFCGNCYIKNN